MDLKLRINIIKYWYRLEYNIVLVHRATVHDFKDATRSIEEIQTVISQFEKEGTVMPKENDRKNTVRVQENIATVAQAINQSKRLRTRKLSGKLSLSDRPIRFAFIRYIGWVVLRLEWA